MSFFKRSKPNKVENWVCVMERNIEFEVEMAKNYLANRRIPSNILNKRDSAHSINIGEMSLIYLYVPKEFEKRARKVLAEFQDELDDES
ncbi:MAG: hypothetical protein GVY08_01945 [Bacteroidetes bacterium]|jgi:hypothetical protein|nr:hypothetical protein [Bacteroidota bacterium]